MAEEHGLFSDTEEDYHNSEGDQGTAVMTTLIAGAAVAILAPELLAGMAIGVGAVIAPRVLPVVGNLLRPIVRTAVRAGYATALTTRELVAEAGEQMQDLVAEARSQGNGVAAPRRAGGRRRAGKRR